VGIELFTSRNTYASILLMSRVVNLLVHGTCLDREHFVLKLAINVIKHRLRPMWTQRLTSITH